MLEPILIPLAALRVFFRSRGDNAVEILALRQQLAVLKRKQPRPRLNPLDRLFWIGLRHLWSRWADLLVIAKPQTVVRWQRAEFRLFWKWRSRPRGGRPKTTAEVRTLIRRMARENPSWARQNYQPARADIVARPLWSAADRSVESRATMGRPRVFPDVLRARSLTTLP